MPKFLLLLLLVAITLSFQITKTNTIDLIAFSFLGAPCRQINGSCPIAKGTDPVCSFYEVRNDQINFCAYASGTNGQSAKGPVFTIIPGWKISTIYAPGASNKNCKPGGLGTDTLSIDCECSG